jgi:ABC-type transporter Mla subunit MlaD
MRRRGGIQGVASSPAIVGAVTVLVVIVAVFLAYNANNGLPFVATYNLNARLPNADALVKGNEVRIGGSRVGVVSAVKPVQTGNGGVAAELELHLDKGAEPIPVDSTIIVRPKSPLGLKYLQIVPGSSSKGLAAGETIPLSAARPEPVDIDQFFDMFDERTREAIKRNQAGFGNAFAGRGPQLNAAFGEIRSAVEHGQPVLRTLVSPSTGFGEFWRALEQLSATVAPVAETQASMFVALDRTFAAFARVSRPFIQETISKGPRTLDAVNADLPALRPFFHDSARFFTAFKPGAKALAETSPTIDAALRAGIPALNRSPALYAQLTPTAEALLDFQSSPGVFNGLELLTDTNRLLAPSLKTIAPAQVTCNYLSLTFKNLADAFSETNGTANWLSAITFEPADGPNAEGAPASAPANGPEGRNHLHFNPYPRTGQGGVCEAGNERYIPGQTVIGRSPKLWGTKTTNEEEEE